MTNNSYLIPTLLVDWYKVEHFKQYPKGTELIFSTLTPRSNKHKQGYDKAMFFGARYLVTEYLMILFNNNFFNLPKEDVLNSHSRIVKNSLGTVHLDHIGNLHDLGYLPVEINALPEGTLVPMQVPMLTIHNTVKEFFWLPSMLETIISNTLWFPITTATVAHKFREQVQIAKRDTSDSMDGLKFLVHDFSMRGISSLESAMMSASSHLLHFEGEETVPAVMFLENYYGANVEKELVSSGIPATEHSVMCSNTSVTQAEDRPDEYESLKRLMTEVYPNGALSIVSDTYDFWHNVTVNLPKLKDVIMNRDGFISIRPDSGDPVEIMCGKDMESPVTPQEKGLIETLWDIFGGTVNSKGYKVLDSHIRAIYGDSMTPERTQEIYDRLKKKGFSVDNYVLAAGSYTYQMNTRDSFGMAVKATHAIIDGKDTPLFKNPKTDSGKRSQRGAVTVFYEDETLKFEDNLTMKEFHERKYNSAMHTLFKDGVLLVEESLSDIRKKIDTELDKRLGTSVV